MAQNNVAVAIISSHINEEANTPSTSSNIAPKKKGRKPFSAEVRLQKAEEKLAQKNAKKQKKINGHLINYLIKLILKYFIFIFKII